MDRIAFVIAPHGYGAGRATGVEPVLNSTSVPDLFKRADGASASYAGMAPPEPVLEGWRKVLEAGGSDRMRILGCGCGDWDCVSVRVRVEVVGETVRWSNFWGSNPPTGDQRARMYDELGAYEFSRADYEAALAYPAHAERFIRERPD